MSIDRFLYGICFHCEGKGELFRYIPNTKTILYSTECHHCKGTGKKLNDDGVSILELVKTFLR